MPKTKKILAITSLFIFLGMFFTFTNNANAMKYTAQIGFGEIFSKEVEIGPDSIGTYITEIYKYAVSIVGILASIVIMWGGVRWLTAGGDKTAVDDAKKWIEGALSGLILVMTSYMILYFVNPDLIKFKSIKIDPIKNNNQNTSGSGNGTGTNGSCIDITTTSICNTSAGCEWINGSCTPKIADNGGAKCGLSNGEMTGSIHCCKNGTNYQYARIVLNKDCRQICGEGWSAISDSNCQTALGY